MEIKFWCYGGCNSLTSHEVDEQSEKKTDGMKSYRITCQKCHWQKRIYTSDGLESFKPLEVKK